MTLRKQNVRKAAPPKPRRRRQVRFEKPSGLSLLLIILFAALLVVLILFAPPSSQEPAANISGIEAVSADKSTGNPAVCITEVMSSNRTAIPDETGAFPDWIEITNTSEETADISGYGLSDRSDKIAFVFPSMTLAPGERILVYASDSTQSETGRPLHAKFKLSSSGDDLYLFGSDGISYEHIEVPAMDHNMTYCRINGDQWIITDQYTPGYDNTQEGYAQFRSSTVLATGALVINEVCASSITSLQDEDGQFPDWIELHNTSDTIIDLSNYALSDSTEKLVKWRFPEGCTIAPGGYYVVFASGKDHGPVSADAHPHTNFKLRSDSGSVILSDIQGRMIDLTTYDLLGADTSWGRDEDLDSSSFKVFKMPTPGLPNSADSTAALDSAYCLRNTTGLYITEVITGNKNVHGPGVNNCYDYIEICNMGSEAVNLKGYGLSDNIKKPRKWQFPDLTIEPGAYMVIYCDKTQTSKKGSYTFTDFNLKKAGETVCLATPSGEIIDRIVVPQLYDDTSYGRVIGQAGLFYFSSPTPGEPNSAGFTGYAEAPEFEVKGGLLERPLEGDKGVTIKVPVNSVVRYTTDGSDPDASSALYTGPIPIETTTVLRARAFRDGVEPSQIVSQTYLISVYHTMPVVCLTTDPDHLNNPDNGMFADGPTLDRDAQERPWKNATYWQKNWFTGWVEYYDENGVQQIDQGMSFRVMGMYSLDMPQKSLYVKADGQFGTDSFDYALFDDRPYTSYASFCLRNGGQDGLYTRVIDGMQSRLLDAANTSVPHQAWKPVIVYINGQYWGHYNLRERAGAAMAAQFEGWSNPDDIDMLESNGTSSTQVVQGSNTDYKALVEYVQSHDLVKDREAYEYVLSQVDLDNMIDYFIFESFFGNTDPGNIRFYRNAKTGDGKWRYLFYDSDWGFFNVLAAKKLVGGVAYVLNEKGMGSQKIKSNVLIRNLIKVPEVQDRFLTRYGELFQTIFRTDYMTDLFNSMIAQIKPEMAMHMQRWAALVHPKVSFDQPKNADGAYNYWVTRCERTLTRIFPRRPYYMWQEIQSYFNLSKEKMESYFGPCPANPDAE